MNIIHDVFISAAEREIHTGDGIFFNIITKVYLRRLFLPFFLLRTEIHHLLKMYILLVVRCTFNYRLF